jgi:hypothetical protein
MRNATIAFLGVATGLLGGCDGLKKDVVGTTEGVIVADAFGGIYKMSGGKLVRVEETSSAQAALVRTATAEVASSNATLKIDLQCKVFEGRVSYIVRVSVKPGSAMNNMSTDELLSTDGFGRVDGLRAISIQFLDKDGFEIGIDRLPFDDTGWTRIVNAQGKAVEREFKGERASDQRRMSSENRINILWQ